MTDRESLQVQFKLTESARAERLIKAFFSSFTDYKPNSKQDRNTAICFERFGVLNGGFALSYGRIAEEYGVSRVRGRDIVRYYSFKCVFALRRPPLQ